MDSEDQHEREKFTAEFIKKMLHIKKGTPIELIKNGIIINNERKYLSEYHIELLKKYL